MQKKQSALEIHKLQMTVEDQQKSFKEQQVK